MLHPSETLHRWLSNPFSLEPSGHVRAAMRQLDRYDDEGAQHYLDWSTDDYTKFAELIDQQRLEFAEEDRHENVRRAICRYLDTVVSPSVADPSVRKLSQRLRDARQTGTIMYNPTAGKFITMWDNKAGLPLLCPDDAREEAMRVSRRVVPAVLKALEQKGARAYSCVFTVENSEPGKLRAGMRRLSKKFNALMRKCKRDQSLPILGAYAVMESPLGGYRTWHPHLNVILVTSGWFDYAKLRAMWMANVHVERLEGSPASIEAALRELIKYSVRAVPEKSEVKASGGASLTGAVAAPLLPGCETSLHDAERPQAPPMIEWTAEEWCEWWYAHKGFRRSRGYGCLYRIDEPEPESIEGFVAVGTVRHDGSMLVRRFSLLESIPGDKSSTMSRVEQLKAHLRRLFGPPDKPDKALRVMSEGLAAWQTIKNQMQ